SRKTDLHRRCAITPASAVGADGEAMTVSAVPSGIAAVRVRRVVVTVIVRRVVVTVVVSWVVHTVRVRDVVMVLEGAPCTRVLPKDITTGVQAPQKHRTQVWHPEGRRPVALAEAPPLSSGPRCLRDETLRGSVGAQVSIGGTRQQLPGGQHVTSDGSGVVTDELRH